VPLIEKIPPALKDGSEILAGSFVQKYFHPQWLSIPGQPLVGKDSASESDLSQGALPEAGQNGFDAGYWSQRLIHRKYTEAFQADADCVVSFPCELILRETAITSSWALTTGGCQRESWNPSLTLLRSNFYRAKRLRTGSSIGPQIIQAARNGNAAGQ